VRKHHPQGAFKPPKAAGNKGAEPLYSRDTEWRGKTPWNQRPADRKKAD